VSAAFRARVVAIAAELGLEASWLMACMAFETGRSFAAAVRNPSSGYVGLIQFGPAAAADLGTTLAALAAMTAEQQLEYVLHYFRLQIARHGALRTLSDVYMAILWPAKIGAAESDVLFAAPSAAYNSNRALDQDNDGRITKAEAASFPTRLLAEGQLPGNVFTLEGAVLASASAPPAAAAAPPPMIGGADNSNAIVNSDDLRRSANTLREQAADDARRIGGDATTTTTNQGAPMLPIAIPLLMQLIPQVLGLFSGRAQAAIADKTGADPQLAGQFFQTLIGRVGEAVGVPVKDDTAAVQAVAALTKQVAAQQLDIKKLEELAQDDLHALTQAGGELVEIRQREVAISTGSADAAANRKDSRALRLALLKMVVQLFGALSVMLFAVLVVGMIFAPDHKPDAFIVGAFVSAFSTAVGFFGAFVHFAVGTTESSGAKDLVLGEVAARRQPQGG
jgi:hypothetical protein